MKILTNNKAQAFVVIIIIVLVVGMIVTSMVLSSIADTRKTQQQRDYERAYSVAEDKILRVLASGNTDPIFSPSVNPSVPDTTSFLDANEVCGSIEQPDSDSSIVNCSYPDISGNYDSTKKKITLIRTKKTVVENYTIEKDDTYEVNLEYENPLSYFDDYIEFGIRGADAVVLTFIYQNGSNFESQTIGIKKDGVADYGDGFIGCANSTCTSLNRNPSYVTSSSYYLPSATISFNIDLKTWAQAGGVTLSDTTAVTLRLLFMGTSSATLSYRSAPCPCGGSITPLPTQVVEYISKATPDINLSTVDVSQASVQALLQYKPRLPSIFDYSLFVGAPGNVPAIITKN